MAGDDETKNRIEDVYQSCRAQQRPWFHLWRDQKKSGEIA